jgi:protein-disulfide isomerase
MQQLGKGLTILTIAALVAATVTAPAAAQRRRAGMPAAKAEEMKKKVEKKKKAEAVDRQYKATLKKTGPDGAPAANDPWATMRAPANPNP